MSHYLRLSPLPITNDQAEAAAIAINTDRNTLRFTRGTPEQDHVAKLTTFEKVFPASVEDSAVVINLKQVLAPAIAARNNVTLLLWGHKGAGKTCLVEQLLPPLMDSLKSAVISADEAQQENANLGLDTPAVKPLRQGTDAQTPPKQITGETSLNFDSTTKVQTAAKETSKPAVETLSPSRHGKYSLMMARMPRDSGIIDMEEVDFHRSLSFSPQRILLPKLDVIDRQQAASMSLDGERGEKSPTKLKLRLLQLKTPKIVEMGSRTSFGERNGRSSTDHLTLKFNGKFYLEIPSIPQLDIALKGPGIRISFWMKCNSPELSAEGVPSQNVVLQFIDPHEPNYLLRLMLNTNESGQAETGSTLVTLRDANGKVLETSFDDASCDGNWHFISVSITCGSRLITYSVDHRPCRSHVSSQDSVAVFHEGRKKLGLIGAGMQVSADGTKTVCNYFSGFLYGLDFADGNESTIVHYSMRATALPYTFRENGHLYDSLTPVGEVDFQQDCFCVSTPVFDGLHSFVNLGPIADLGLFIPGTALDITFRTAFAGEPMTLIGISDSVGKNPGFALELNVNAQGSYQRHHVCFSVTDYDGNITRCGCDLNEVFDERWHTLNIRIVDLSSAKFKVRVNGRMLEMNANGSVQPLSLVSYTQSVSLGCLNNKGKYCRFFRGGIQSVRITKTVDDVDELFAEWLLNEGPGAKVASDTSGHGLHGVYVSGGKKRSLIWVPAEGNVEKEDEPLINDATVGVVRYTNNQVTMAFVAITYVVDPETQFVHDRLLDLINNKTYKDLEPKPHLESNPRLRSEDTRNFLRVPEVCFRRVSPSDYMTVFRAGLGRSQEISRAHFVLLFRLGDATFTVIDPMSLSKSQRSTFIPAQLAWSDTLVLFGSENKLNFAINNSLVKTEKLLLSIGSRPELYKRGPLMNLRVATQFDNMLTNIVASSLLSSKEHSFLHVIHVVSPFTTPNEALHSLLFMRRLKIVDQVCAGIVLQKLARCIKSKKIFASKVANRDAASARRDKMILLKKQYPKETAPKAKRLALLIKCLEFDYDETICNFSQNFDDVKSVPRLLEAQGFGCELMLNPSRKNLLEGLKNKRNEAEKQDAQLFVYFIGVGLCGGFHIPQTSSDERSWLAEVERAQRLELLATQRKEWIALKVDQFEEILLLDEQLRIAAEELAKKNAKKKKGKGKKEDPPPPVVERVRPDTKMFDRVMSLWDAEIAPTISHVASKHSAAQLAAFITPQPYILPADVSSLTSPSNTIYLEDMKRILISDPPKRGEHVIFAYDCLTFPTALNTTFGFGGICASSGENLHVEYRKQQQLLLGYYLKKSLFGNPAEFVRVGKHDPPPSVSLEAAFRYLEKKIGPSSSFSTLQMKIDWFGEFVGEFYLAPKVLMKKEERRKVKAAGSKKQVNRIDVILIGAIPADWKVLLSAKIQKILKATGTLDVRRCNLWDHFNIVCDGDFNAMNKNELCRAEFDDWLRKLIPGVKKLKWTPKSVCPLRIQVSPTSTKLLPLFDESKEQKLHAQLYTEAQEKSADEIDNRVLKTAKTLNEDADVAKSLPRFPFIRTETGATIFVNLSEDDAVKLDRACRLGELRDSWFSASASRTLLDKDVSEYEQHEKLIAMEEARRLAENKLRLVREAEERKKAEEERQKMLKRKEAVLQKLDGARTVGIKAEELAFYFSVPLPDACAPVVEMLANIGNKSMVDSWVASDLEGKLLSCTRAGFIEDQRLVTALLKMSDVLVSSGRSSLAAKLCSEIICRFSWSFPQPFYRAFQTSLTTIGNVDDAVSFSSEASTVLVTKIDKFPSESKAAVLPFILKLTGCVGCLTSALSMSCFGEAKIFEEMGREGKLFVFGAGCFSQFCEWIGKQTSIPSSILSAAVQGIFASPTEVSPILLSKLSDPMSCQWKESSAKLFQKLYGEASELSIKPLLEPLHLRLLAEFPPQ